MTNLLVNFFDLGLVQVRIIRDFETESSIPAKTSHVLQQIPHN